MTSPFVTAKLKLDVDPMGDLPVESPNSNWDKVDKAAGIIYIDNPTDPHPIEYPGALICVKSTGIAYTLVDNGAGGFNKRYVQYPYIYVAVSQIGVIPPSGDFLAYGWNEFHPDMSVNASAADMTLYTGWKAPIKAIYEISCMFRYNTSGAGQINAAIIDNNDVRLFEADSRNLSSTFNTNTLTVNKIAPFNAGDSIIGGVYTVNGGTQVYTSIFVSCVRPVP
jgi:hypothetical protein